MTPGAVPSSAPAAASSPATPPRVGRRARTYATYCDARFLVRALALHASLRRHDPTCGLFVLCLDHDTWHALVRLAPTGVTAVPLAALEDADPALVAVKAQRTTVEYYFTLTPSWMRYVLHRADVDLVTYLDADLFFFDDPQPLFDELGPGHVAIVPHRFPPALRQREVYGRFNVGWVTIRRSVEGMACVDWWRERCLEWCHDRVEDGRFADQRYLDDWPTRFHGAVVITHTGANVAPWNVAGAPLTSREGGVDVDGQPLLFYHFHRLEPVTRRLYATHLRDYGVCMTPVLRRHVYHPYLVALHIAQLGMAATIDPLAVARSRRAASGATWRLAASALRHGYAWR